MNHAGSFTNRSGSDSVARRQLGGKSDGQTAINGLEGTGAGRARGRDEPPSGCGSVLRVDIVGDPVDAQRRATGSFMPKPQGGDRRSQRVETRHAEVMAASGRNRIRASRSCGRVWLVAVSPHRPRRCRASSTGYVSHWNAIGPSGNGERAGPFRRPAEAPRLVRGPARSRS